MATLTYQIPRRKGNWGVQYFPEAASQSFKAGDVLSISTSGTVSIASASGTDYDTDADDFVGIAAEDASGTTNNYVQVHIPEDNSACALFPLEHATATSAVTAESLVGDTYVLSHNSGIWAVAIDNSTKPIVKIVDIASDYAVGEQHGTVWVKFLSTARFLV